MNIIIIHGLGSHPTDETHFQPLISYLAEENHNIYRFDWDSTISTRQLEDLDDLVMIGHSLGGWRATALSTLMKKKVRLLVLLDPVWKDKWLPFGRRNFYIDSNNVNKALCWYRNAWWFEPPFAGKISNQDGINFINYPVNMGHPEIRDNKLIAENISRAIKEL